MNKNKILLAFANAEEDLKINDEAQKLQEADRLDIEAEVITRWNTDWEKLTKTIRDHSDISVFHFGGHAGHNRLELEHFGSVEPIFEEGLTNYLADLDNLQLVFLNGCSTKTLGQELVDKGIPYVIATSIAIKDAHAINFSKYFYEEFARNISIKEAFENAKNRIRAKIDNEDKLYETTLFKTTEKGLKLKKAQDNIGFPWKLYQSQNPEDWRIKSPSKQMRAYYRDIQELYHEKALGEKEARLSDLYIVPNFKIHSRCFDKNVEKDNEGFSNEVHSNIHKFILKTFLQEDREDYKCKSKNAKLLVLLGQPGQGKTSFCTRVIHDFLKSDNYRWTKKCYFLRLRDLPKAKEFIGHPIEEVKKYFQREYDLDFYPENALLILDGLDELCMSAGLTNLEIKELINDIYRMLQKEHRSLHCIITSRYNYFNINDIDGQKAWIVKLNELSLNQQITWLGDYKQFHPKALLTIEKLQEVNKTNNKNFKPIRELINQPILLHLIAKIDLEINAKDNRAAIYQKLFDTLSNQSWNKEAKDRYTDEFTSERLRTYLSSIAYHIYISDYEYIKRNDLEQLEETEDFIGDCLQTDIELSQALKEVLVSFYFRNRKKEAEDDFEKDKENYAVEFMHKSLQEYLVAEYLYKTIREEFLETKRNSKKYIINNWEAALKFIWELCSHQRLSDEVRDYLLETIQNDTGTRDKLELATRMAYFLDDLLKQQFIWVYEASEINYQPIEKGVTCFYTYWQILSHLQEKPLSQKDYFYYFNIKSQSYFTAMLQITSYYKYYNVNLKYLDLSNIQIYGWIGFYINLQNTNLRGGEFHGANFSRGNLSNSDLTGIDLSYSNLSNVKLDNSDLRYSSLNRVNLRNGSLRDSNLSNATLNSTNLNGVDLRNAILYRANLGEADISEANLVKINLEEASLNRANLSESELQSANLKGADMREANLSLADFSDANLQYVNLSRANLTYISLCNADLRNSNLDEADLSFADFQRANLNGIDLRNVRLQETNFKDADLGSVNLSNLNLKNIIMCNTNLSYSDLSNTDLNDANLSNANLSNANLSNANLSNVNLSNANLSNANLSNANLSSANLNNATLSRATLSRANLDSADLSGADLSGADLTYTDLSSSNLINVDFSNTKLTQTNINNVKIDKISWLNYLETLNYPPLGLDELKTKYQTNPYPEGDNVYRIEEK